MKSRYALILSLLSMCTLAGCPCPDKPERGTVIPIATTPTTECKPNRPDSVTGQTGEVTEGTYCVCNAGHNVHGSYEGPHLAKGETIVISPVDLVTDVQFGAAKVPMTLSSDKRQLTAVLNYGHEKTEGGAAATVNHLVQIEPAAIDERETPGCSADPSRNSLRISFCSRKEDTGQWACGRESGDGGDTHVQN